jgi:hypothetical protein
VSYDVPGQVDKVTREERISTEDIGVRKYAKLISGFSQFCHADEGKGTGIKTDCRRGWPGCGPHHDTMGCHYMIGSTGMLGQAERRRLEETYGIRTRDAINAAGLWPKRLPQWPR